LNEHQYDRAIEQAIKLYQTNIAARLVRGVINVRMQNHEVAIADFDTGSEV